MTFSPLSQPRWTPYLSCLPQVTAQQHAYSSQLNVRGSRMDRNFGFGWNWLVNPYIDLCDEVATTGAA